ncbi:HAD family phosphatase [Micromonospora sp. C28SCA-DRY-2]|uniref:HAD family hydrolase n=1 Tax=Micromonospora sp. C28SCA-DRY-2 TaxID=3059522 RepID=UPI0026775EC2|nr:HAD family phosphatase [Micromonospora sp. C28SCA-DRY-2]MDO3702424.1 HAD family phosphatase [Micromonospora sp. C28SCA-DRY-2]
MTTRAVLVDIGGVLEITPSLGVTERWETTLGLRPGELDERAAGAWAAGAVGEITLDEVHAGLAALLSLPPERVTALMADMWVEYLGSPNEELIEYVRALRSRCRTGIISNSFVGAREREQERYGFADLTDVLVYSHEVGLSKPDPRIYQLACDRLGVPPEHALFLDDVPAAVDGARAVGMHGVLFTTNAQAVAEIEQWLRES